VSSLSQDKSFLRDSHEFYDDSIEEVIGSQVENQGAQTTWG
jgi:hypothetical protein